MATKSSDVIDVIEERLTREQVSHAALDVAAQVEDEWEPTLFTKAPPPRDGMEQRWVRHRSGGVDDISNVLRRRQQGWEIRYADTLPAGYLSMTANWQDLTGIIQNQDCILMERRIDRGDKMRMSIAKQTDRLGAAVKNHIANNMPAQPGTNGGEIESLDLRVTSGHRRATAFAD